MPSLPYPTSSTTAAMRSHLPHPPSPNDKAGPSGFASLLDDDALPARNDARPAPSSQPSQPDNKTVQPSKAASNTTQASQPHKTPAEDNAAKAPPDAAVQPAAEADPETNITAAASTDPTSASTAAAAIADAATTPDGADPASPTDAVDPTAALAPVIVSPAQPQPPVAVVMPTVAPPSDDQADAVPDGAEIATIAAVGGATKPAKAGSAEPDTGLLADPPDATAAGSKAGAAPDTAKPAPTTATTAAVEPIVGQPAEVDVAVDAAPQPQTDGKTETKPAPHQASADIVDPAGGRNQVKGADPAPTAPATLNPVPHQTATTSAAAAPIVAAPTTTAGPSAPVPMSGVAVEIVARALPGNHRFDIRLDPPELGRIDVRLDVDRHGNVTSHLVVERSQTLDLLRRDAPQLQQALQDSGLKSGDLQLSLRDPGHGGQQQRDPNDTAGSNRLVIPDDDLPPLETARGYGRLLGRPGGLDIRV